jgi:hypothetical protein
VARWDENAQKCGNKRKDKLLGTRLVSEALALQDRTGPNLRDDSPIADARQKPNAGLTSNTCKLYLIGWQ